MLNKNEIKELLKNKEYTEIIYIFKKEYCDLVINFSKRNKLDLPNDAEIEEIISEISFVYPSLDGYMNTLSAILFSPDMNIGDSLDYMISNYESIKKALT